MDDEDVDVYFAQYDIQTVVSDVLYELGFHRPKEVGPFLAGYIARRFQIEGQVGGASGTGGGISSSAAQEDYAAIEVHPSREPDSEEQLAAQLLLEVRALRRKYQNFKSEATTPEDEDEEDVAAFSIIPWSDFAADYERLLQLFSSAVFWNFCDRRLSVLRSLFDAHRVLNASAEEAEAKPTMPSRVDNSLQLARSLPPGRLLAFVEQKARGLDHHEDEEEDHGPKLLQDCLDELGRRPTPADLTADADEKAPANTSLKGLLSGFSNPVSGRYLQEILKASVALLDSTSAATGGESFAEYRLPLHGESTAWSDLARWWEDLGYEYNEHSHKSSFVIQLPQIAFVGLKESRTVLSFGELLANVFGPPLNLVKEPASKNQDNIRLHHLLETVSGFEVSAFNAGAESISVPEINREPVDWTDPSSPPFAYQLYHVWARLKSLNHARAEIKEKELELRAAVSSPEGLACAYLLGAASVSRASSLASHSPLQYLFALDQVGVSVSLCSQRSLAGAGEAGHKAFDKLFRAGVRVALCTEDPSVSHHSDDPLGQEFGLARSLLGLNDADLEEICSNSKAMSTFPELRAAVTPPAVEEKPATSMAEVIPWGTIRHRFREARREAELAWIQRLVPEKDKKDV